MARTPGTHHSFTRLNININGTSSNALARLMDHHGVTATEVVRRALALYDFVDRHDAAGDEILVRTGTGEERKVVLL